MNNRIQGYTIGAMFALGIYLGIMKPDAYMLTSFLGAGALIEVLMMFNIIKIRSRWMYVMSGFPAIYGLLGFLPHA
jgi:hypothetical protein